MKHARPSMARYRSHALLGNIVPEVADFVLSNKKSYTICEQAPNGLGFSIWHDSLSTRKKHHPRSSYVLKNGTHSASSGARTLDTLIKSQVLYQLS